MTGIGSEAEIATISNLEFEFENRKMKENVKCDKDIKDHNLEYECIKCSYQTNTKDLLNKHMILKHAKFEFFYVTSVDKDIAIYLL